MAEQFAIVPLEVIRDDRLTKMQMRVLLAILSIRDRKADTMWIKREKISERCGYNERTVSKVTTQLVELGWLDKTGKGGFSRPCEYRVKIPETSISSPRETVSELDTEDAENGSQTGNGIQSGAFGVDSPVDNEADTSIHAGCSDAETVPEVETVSSLSTVPELGSETVPEPWSKTVPGLNRGKDQTINRPLSNPIPSTYKFLRECVSREVVEPGSVVNFDIRWRPNLETVHELARQGFDYEHQEWALQTFLAYWSDRADKRKTHGQFEERYIKHVKVQQSAEAYA